LYDATAGQDVVELGRSPSEAEVDQGRAPRTVGISNRRLESHASPAVSTKVVADGHFEPTLSCALPRPTEARGRTWAPEGKIAFRLAKGVLTPGDA
jgi:hypothetical protein